MLYWYPKVASLPDVNSPATVFVPLHEDAGYRDLDVNWDTGAVREAVHEVGGPPAFVRTDRSSNKHHMEDASRLPADDDKTIDDHVYNVVSHSDFGLNPNEDAEKSVVAFNVPYEALAIREWLDLWHEFTVFKGTKVAAERRYFVEDGEVVESYFYWPAETLEVYGVDLDEDRRRALERTRERSCDDDGAREQLRSVADGFEGAWSVDFALTVDGTWHLVDMAMEDTSWSPVKTG